MAVALLFNQWKWVVLDIISLELSTTTATLESWNYILYMYVYFGDGGITKISDKLSVLLKNKEIKKQTKTPTHLFSFFGK